MAVTMLTIDPHLPTANPLTWKRVFLVGIKGVGMTSLAIMLQQAELQVSGADVSESFVTDVLLEQAGIACQNLTEPLPETIDGVIYSGAHQGQQHPLVQAAQQRGIPTLSLAQAVGKLSQQKPTIAVCGVGGKTTTSALLSWILRSAGANPSFSIGVGSVPNLGTSGYWDQDSDWFVVEGDEYVADPIHDHTPRFLYLTPQHMICTSLAFDHPDVYRDFTETQRVFGAAFAKLTPASILVYNGDDEALAGVVTSRDLPGESWSVGTGSHNRVRIEFLSPEPGYVTAALLHDTEHDDQVIAHLQLPILGRHNLLNAAYASILAWQLGVERAAIESAVAVFRSTQRRVEWRGRTASGVQCYDDYAHHPRELIAVCAALQEAFPARKRLVAFQPHTFSRTRELLTPFAEALANAKAEVILLPIFASAREQDDGSIQSHHLAQAIRDRGGSVTECASLQALVQLLEKESAPTVFLTAGAGDIYTVYDQLHLDTSPASVS